jgi:hypothetical protein
MFHGIGAQLKRCAVPRRFIYAQDIKVAVGAGPIQPALGENDCAELKIQRQGQCWS